MIMMTLDEVWAKTNPFQSILTHGKVSGLIAQFLLREYICEGTKEYLSRSFEVDLQQLENFIGYYVSLHDIGKIGSKFQSGETGKFNNIRHEKTTFQAVMHIWTAKYSIEKRIARVFGEILQAHHQGKTGIEEECDAEWKSLQDEFESEMAEFFGNKALRIPTQIPAPQGAAEAILLGIVILSDWLASGNLFYEADEWKNNLREKTHEVMEHFADESGLLPVQNDFGNKFHEVWPNIPEGGERGLQALCQEIFGGPDKYTLVLMEAPMGEGKTEAAVYAAMQLAKQWGKDGFYIGLPTSATSNQMVLRMNEFLAMHKFKSDARLLHSYSWLEENDVQYNSEEEKYIYHWLMPSRKAMLSQFAVGTVDQAMMASMCIRYGVLRLLGLTGKVFIIDEIHAYDLYMMNILTGLLSWCKALQIPVILLSATLPEKRKKELLAVFSDGEYISEYPAITTVSDKGTVSVRRINRISKQNKYLIEMKPMLHSCSDIASLAIERVKNGGCCCVIVNTVRQAQEIYQSIVSESSDIEVMLFHSRFLVKDRNTIEKECVRKYGKDGTHRPARSILVATQVVEQSLDVDFDFMISSIAPADLLLQRMGRLFRHDSTRRPPGVMNPVMTILVPDNGDYGNDAYVYDSCVLKQTEFVLSNYETISVPGDVEKIINECYDIQYVPEDRISEWKEYESDIAKEAAQSDKYKLAAPNKKFTPLYADVDFDDEEKSGYLSAQTRLSEPTVTLSIIDDNLFDQLKTSASDHYIKVKSKNLARVLMENSTNLRERTLDRLLAEYNIETLRGKLLAEGCVIISNSNGIISADQNIGVIWKED